MTAHNDIIAQIGRKCQRFPPPAGMLLGALLVVVQARGQPPESLPAVQVQTDQSFGTESLSFNVSPGHRATLLKPNRPAARGSKPWIFFAPGGALGNNHSWMCKQFLDAGFWIGYVSVDDCFGTPASRKVFTDFYTLAVKEFGLHKKVCIMPQSRGGLMLYNWAVEHPEWIQCVGGIYPVCDISRCSVWGAPLPQIAKCYGLSEDDMKAQSSKNNPIDRLATLAKSHIPIFHITGDVDRSVPMEENSLELERRYRALGGQMEVQIVPGKGHEECPEIFRSQRFVAFVLSQMGP